MRRGPETLYPVVGIQQGSTDVHVRANFGKIPFRTAPFKREVPFRTPFRQSHIDTPQDSSAQTYEVRKEGSSQQPIVNKIPAPRRFMRHQGTCTFPDCIKHQKCPSDLIKQTMKNHSRAQKYSPNFSKYVPYEFPIVEVSDHHVNEKHCPKPRMYQCLSQSCLYESRRVSNWKRHIWERSTVGLSLLKKKNEKI